MAQEFWFNTTTNTVMRGDDPDLPRGADMMGPYATEDEAAHAYEKAASRTEEWDAEDRADDAWASGDADSSKWDNNPLNG